MYINSSTSLAIFRWQPAAWLRITGEDAAGFLQGQFSNDLRPLERAECRAVYGLWLTLKGKVLADSFVMPGAVRNEFWVGSYFSPAGIIRERLESHVIADDVVVEDLTDQWAGVTLMGEGAMAGEAEAGRGGGMAFPGRRGREESLEVMYRRADGEPSWLGRFGGSAVAADEMDRRRIAAGIPAVPTDIGPGDLPNEAGLEAAAISYTKGCYLGQEVMARLKAMGEVRRRLVRVEGSGAELPAAPAPVFAGLRQVGELRSVAAAAAGGWSGLALVTRLHVRAGDGLALAAEAAPVLRVLDAP